MCHIWHSNREEVRKHMIKRTISGMIGAGSLAHNRGDFVAENVEPKRTQYNICYRNENLQEVYKELFDEAVERYNVGKRNDRKITNYYEKIRLGKQEKLFHEVIFQIGNCGDMAVGTEEGELAVKILDEFLKDFEKRNPTLRLFNCYLHLDESTPHLHVDFVPYVSGWTGKGMDTKVSLKQALKSLGFPGGSKRDTELNQWINHEKEVLAEVAKKYGIEWEQKGTHEEHLDVYNFKKKERKKEVQELEQEKEYLITENEALTLQIAEGRYDIKILKEEKERTIKEKETAEKQAEETEKQLKNLEERRGQLQPIIDNVSRKLRECQKLVPELPEVGTLERAVAYRDKKIKPLFNQMKGIIAGLVAQVQELSEEVESWKSKYQKGKHSCETVKRNLQELQQENQYLYREREDLQAISNRYDRVERVLGTDIVEEAVQQDIQREREIEEQRRKEQSSGNSILELLKREKRKSMMQEHQQGSDKKRYRGMEI